MKTSTKNFITMVVFYGIFFVWFVSGAVASPYRNPPAAWWISHGVLFVVATIFFIAGMGAQSAEDKASKK